MKLTRNIWRVNNDMKIKEKTRDTMKKYEVVIKRPNGEEEVIHKNLTEEQTIEYTDYIDNTYYKEQDMQ